MLELISGESRRETRQRHAPFHFKWGMPAFILEIVYLNFECSTSLLPRQYGGAVGSAAFGVQIPVCAKPCLLSRIKWSLKVNDFILLLIPIESPHDNLQMNTSYYHQKATNTWFKQMKSPRSFVGKLEGTSCLVQQRLLYHINKQHCKSVHFKINLIIWFHQEASQKLPHSHRHWKPFVYHYYAVMALCGNGRKLVQLKR